RQLMGDTSTIGSREAAPRKPAVQSVARAARILLAVASTPEGLTAKQVAESFELALPTAYHLLSTLTGEGLLAKDGQRRYVVGPQAAVIAHAMMRDAAPPESYVEALRRLAEETGEMAYLSAWRRGQIEVLEQVAGAHAVAVGAIATGFCGEPHARATGKLLLAYADDVVRETVLRATPLRPLTPHTITDEARLREELGRAREDGYACDREEYSLGVTCVSAPIRESGVVVAALTVSAPTPRFLENEAEYIAVALARARDASSG
ncbi:MAG: IclR family transcriptional regulator, partial [Patulibacter sp.]